MTEITKRTKAISLLLAAVIALTALTLSACGEDQQKADAATQAAQATEAATQAATDEIQTGEKEDTQGLYFTRQEERNSPEWVTKLDAAQDAEQMIVVAGIDKSTAYITMHEKNAAGQWRQLIATPGFIGLDGLGDADIDHCYTPVGTFTVDKAFGLADDPGCQMEYTKVDDTYYWSGDPENHFNELVSTNDVPELDTEESEHIADFNYAYQYVLNMGYNSECIVQKGFAFFFHSFRINRPYTGGCVAVPEDIMKFVMQHIKPGCKFTIDSLQNFGGDLDA